MKTYDNWMEAQQNMKYWQEKEKELRMKICDDLLEDKLVGTHNIKKGHYKVKVTKKVSYSIDQDVLGFIWDEMTEEEKEAIKYTPKLLLKEYKDIQDHDILDQAITVKPAMPTLSIEYIES